MENTYYENYMGDLKDYEVAFLEYLKAKEKRRMHWVKDSRSCSSLCACAEN